jgi:hypothetical protein
MLSHGLVVLGRCPFPVGPPQSCQLAQLRLDLVVDEDDLA